ncbi:MAG: cation:proton antiporter [Myxococcota bacterium]|nr:cation:proton antiporter [Myxococcota bacterium]
MINRRLIAIFLLLGIMGGLQYLPGVDVQSTALVGFVLLAAYALAEITSSLKLPRVTGYILAGIAVGPFTSGLVDTATVADFQIFNELALALIALEAGLELHVNSLKKVAKTLGSIVAVKIPLSWLFIGGAFIAAAPLLPVGNTLSMTDKLSIGLVLGAIGVGTSPAVSIAVISELKAKNRLADLVLGIAVAKDVVMIVMLATAITIAGLFAPESQGFDLAVFKNLGAKVTLSLGAGGVLGAGLILWLRFIRWEMVLLLLLLGYGGTDLAETLHLKPLLVFIGAGFTVANFSDFGHDLHKPLALVAVPVFVVFFTTVGAGLDLGAAVAVAPVVGILFVARVAMLAVSTRIGGQLAGEPSGFTNRTWPAFVSQAGVALGLLLIARDSLPQYAALLAQVGTVLVGCNLLIGPILLRLSLTRADQAAEQTSQPVAKADRSRRPVEPELVELHTAIHSRIETLFLAVETDVIRSWLSHAQSQLSRIQTADRQSICASIGPALSPLEVSSAAQVLDGLVRDTREWIQTLPIGLRAPLTGEHLLEPTNARQRVRAFFLAPRTSRGKAMRWVPIRELCRQRIEGLILPELADVLAEIAVLEANRIDTLSHLADEVSRRTVDVEARVIELENSLRAAADTLSRDVRTRADTTVVSLGVALADGGTPRMPSSVLRFTLVAKEVDVAVNRLANAGQTLGTMLASVQGRARVRLALARARSRLADVLSVDFERWHDHVISPSLAKVGDIRSAAARCHARLADHIGSSDALSNVQSDATAFDALVVAGLPVIDSLRVASRAQSPIHGFQEALPKVIDDLPEFLTAVPTDWVPTAKSAWRVPSATVVLKQHVSERVGSELEWTLRDISDRTDRLIARVAHRFGEVAGLAADGYSAAMRGLHSIDTAGEQQSLSMMPADAALGRVIRALDRLGSELNVGSGVLRTELLDALNATLSGAETDALGDSRVRRSRVAQVRRAGEALRQDIARIYSLARLLISQPAAVLARIRSSYMVRDLELLEGSLRLDPHHMRADVLLLSPTKEHIQDLPYLLRRFFSPGALSALGGTPVAAAQAVESIRDAWNRFTTGEPVSMLLSGPEGSGKSSVAQATLRGMLETDVVRVELGLGSRTEAELSRIIGTSIGAFGVGDFSALEAAILKQPKRVFLLDPFEELFSRTPAGLNHVRRVLELIENTRHAVCWVVCINGSARYLLDRMCHFSHAFTDRIVFVRKSGSELAEIMENRAQLAGFQVEYPSPRTAWSWLAGALRTGFRTSELRRYSFYRELARASGGNIADATNLWIRSIEGIDGDIVHVRNIGVPSLAWFGQLGRDAHRLLALAVVAGGVTRSEAREALRWSDDRLAPQWSLLHATGLFRPMESEPDRFEVWPCSWRTVVERLVETGELPAPRDTTEEDEL